MTPLVRSAAAALMLGWLVCGGAAEPDGYTQALELHQKGEDASALKRVDAYLENQPKSSRARFLKSLILAKLNRTPEAIAVLTGLSEEYPELPEPHNNLAVLYASQGQYDEARVELEMAVRAYPNYAVAYQNLGDVYAALAAQAYDKALHLDAKNSTARTRLEGLRTILPAGAVATGPLAATASETAVTRPSAPPTVAQQPGTLPAAPPATPAPGAASNPATAAAPATPSSSAAAGNPSTAAASKPATATFSPPDPARTVLGTVEGWARAWSSKDVDKYLAYYAGDFRTPKGEPRGNWEAARREQITKPRIIAVELVDPKVTLVDPNHATVAFKQNYRADDYRSSGRKTLALVRQGDRWLIQQETITFR